MTRAASLLLALAVGLAAVHTTTAVCDTYVVQAGDTIGAIASMFGVQLSALEEAQTQCNSGYTAGGLLQFQQTLCLPPYYPACLNVKTAGDNKDCKYYTVQGGDTLASIASSLGLALLDMQSANPDTVSLQPNDYVKLPGWNDSCPAPGDTTSCRVYVAQEGDSLASIAISFSVNVADVQEVNPSLSTAADTSAVLQPGQRINIPPFTAACGEGVVVPKPVAGNCFGYEVQTGDTLFDIATMFQTTAALLIEVNPELAAGGVLSPGSQVKLPPYDPAVCVNGITLRPRPATFTPIQPTPGAATPTGQSGPDLGITEGDFAAPAPSDAAAAPAPAPSAFNRRRLI